MINLPGRLDAAPACSSWNSVQAVHFLSSISPIFLSFSLVGVRPQNPPPGKTLALGPPTNSPEKSTSDLAAQESTCLSVLWQLCYTKTETHDSTDRSCYVRYLEGLLQFVPALPAALGSAVALFYQTRRLFAKADARVRLFYLGAAYALSLYQLRRRLRVWCPSIVSHPRLSSRLRRSPLCASPGLSSQGFRCASQSRAKDRHQSIILYIARFPGLPVTSTCPSPACPDSCRRQNPVSWRWTLSKESQGIWQTRVFDPVGPGRVGDADADGDDGDDEHDEHDQPGQQKQQATTTYASGSVFSRTSKSTCLIAASGSISALSPFDTGALSDCDSFVSIVDDPFFQRFDPAITNDNAHAEREASSQVTSAEPLHDSNDNSKTQRWPPPRRESLTIGPSHCWPHHPITTMETYNIAIIGADAVGKSTFVQRALDLPRPPVTNASSARQIVDSVTHIVTLVELELEHFELNSSQPMQWPKQINGHIVPRMDAALILYDVTTEESIRQLPQTVAALTNSGLPAMLGACKCDAPEDDWEVNADELARYPLFRPCIGQYKISTDRPDISRACLQAVVRAAVTHRRDESSETVLRRRAQSAANLEAPELSAGRPLSEHSKHSRASSDFSILRTFSNQQPGENYRSQASRSPRTGFRTDKSGTDTFLDIHESDSESHRYSDDIPILQRNDDIIIEKQPKITGVTFGELVDRLLAPRLSRVDNNFSDIFLCLYRKFAAPGELFSAILVRLDEVRDDKAAHYLTKTATQLRVIEVVAKWVSLYPGDFARPTTRRNLEDFIQHLSTEPIFAISAQQMRRNLYFNVMEDNDTGWANSDDSSDEIASKILSKELNELATGIHALQMDGECDSLGGSEHPSTDRGSRMGIQSQFNSYEEYEREATLLEPSDHLPMNKFRYHIFMDISDDDIADELTRIDWIMFSSIRIRDFVRHVSLSTAQKDKCRSLQNVNRMISHFNHIAKWVANMILLRDKAKHRAQMLDKFMNIALKLRQLNNYNGLAAVLAGINGTAIHRLAQTRTLVPADVQKRFARLVILMGSQKSHFAYRLAWENSSLPRIPFIPLHRRDLVSAEEGSKTFVGPNNERVNWKKFEVLGEVLLPIMKSQGTAYPNLAKHETARDLILGCRMPTDDEEIYQRSLQLESNASAPIEPSKKKFPWFAK